MPPKSELIQSESMININLGILGHIDAGKTSLCRALSTITSTASLDKSSQSQERGITLDLGFSSFASKAPEHFKEGRSGVGRGGFFGRRERRWNYFLCYIEEIVNKL